MALRNLITDVAGVTVGHADDAKLASGVTAIVFDEPAVASIDVRGGGTGTRESVLLDPSMTVEKIDAIALAGGSAFGLDAAAGVMARLAEQGRGFAMRDVAGADRAGRDPVRPAQRRRQGLGPFPALSRARLRGGGGGRRHDSSSAPPAPASARPPPISRAVSAPPRRSSATSRSARWSRSMPAGCVTVGAGPWFWAAPYERDAEFGGRGLPSPMPADALAFRTKGRAGENTTLAVVATDATLNKVQAKRLAIMAQVGRGACHPPGALPARRRPRVHRGDRPPPGCPSRSTASPSSAPPPPMCWPGRWRGRSTRPPHSLTRAPAGLARPFWNNWITGFPKGPAALTLPSR